MSLQGARLRLRIGAVAHGGHCVARIGDDAGVPDSTGRVVFVRHALPGELVDAEVTEDAGGAFVRANAVTIVEAAPGRVPPPCPAAGPGRCGGCDWQHASPAMQRELKAAIVREQFSRLAGLEVEVNVEPLEGGPLGWRTRTLYAVDRTADGRIRVGLRRHRSHDVEELVQCPLGTPEVGGAAALDQVAHAAVERPAASGIEVVAEREGRAQMLVHEPGPPRRGRGRRAPDRVSLLAGSGTVEHQVAGISYPVPTAAFWQVHPDAARTFVATALDWLAPQPGERALDLYAGAGLFTAQLAAAVGPTGAVVGAETAPDAVAAAAEILEQWPHATVYRCAVDANAVGELAAQLLGPTDLVVLDPHRSGAGAAVMTAVLELAPRAVCYVACDPAALARDVRTALNLGWRLSRLRAFDAFPMTQHVECVALLTPADAG